MTERLPRSVQEYLEQLREALADADPALRQDALYDAEEYLRAELNGKSDQPESEVIARIVRTYGAPEEVAAVYRQTEETVSRAMRTPPPRDRRSVLGRFFGVYTDPRAYASLFYMVLTLATGIFYFTWTIAGISVSGGTILLIFGIPIFLLFMGSMRLFSLLEGRIVESLLGVRMPRRPEYPVRDAGWIKRIKAMLTDIRTWTTLLYMVLMLPLGVMYFTFAVTTVTTSVALIVSPLAYLIADSWMSIDGHYFHWSGQPHDLAGWEFVLVPLLGLLALTVSMHVFRGVGTLQGQIARGLLVKPGRD